MSEPITIKKAVSWAAILVITALGVSCAVSIIF